MWGNLSTSRPRYTASTHYTCPVGAEPRFHDVEALCPYGRSEDTQAVVSRGTQRDELRERKVGSNAGVSTILQTRLSCDLLVCGYGEIGVQGPLSINHHKLICRNVVAICL